MNISRCDLRATAGKRKADYRKKEQKDKKFQENWDNRVALPTIGGVRSIVNKKENFFHCYFILPLYFVSKNDVRGEEHGRRRGAGRRGSEPERGREPWGRDNGVVTTSLAADGQDDRRVGERFAVKTATRNEQQTISIHYYFSIFS